METSAVSVHESLNTVLDYQTHFRLRETQGRAFAEDLNERVLYWSVGQSVVIIAIGLGQILVLRSLFTDKHKTATLTWRYKHLGSTRSVSTAVSLTFVSNFFSRCRSVLEMTCLADDSHFSAKL